MEKFVLGVGGYIGAGKSLAGEYFKKRDAEFIDADVVVDALYEPGCQGYLKILNYLGREFLTKKGLINRKKLGKFVFGDANKLKILNFLIHPLVTTEIRKLIDKSSKRFIVVEATYFEKKHLGRLMDAILWIDCEKPILMRRARRQKGFTKAVFERILRAQKRPDKINYSVANNGTKQELYRQLDNLFNK